MRTEKLQKKIGLTAATLILIGYVVGASIFILPSHLAAVAGPAVTISYMIASVSAIFIALVAAQLGAAFPVSGASYVSVGKLLSPFWGYILVCCYLLSSVLGIALVAYGFADYLGFIFNDIDRFWSAILLVVLLMSINLLGVRTLILWQGIMVVLFITALVVFSISGLFEFDTNLLQPYYPNGIIPVVQAAVPAAFSFVGFVVVFIIYIAVSFTIVGNMDLTNISNSLAPVSEISSKLFPQWLASLISFAALLAAITSINGIILTGSREILSIASKGVLPSFLTRISKKSDEPHWSVVVISMLGIACISYGASITKYALVAVVSIMIIQLLIGLAAWKLPRKLPCVYEHSGFKFSERTLKSFSLLTILVAVGFFVAASFEDYQSTLFVVATLAISTFYFYSRKPYFTKYDE